MTMTALNTGHDLLLFDDELARTSLDREPFPFRHDLSGLDLFSFDALTALAHKYSSHPQDYFLHTNAPSPEINFYDVPVDKHGPGEAMQALDQRACRVLLKRPENHDPRFRDLLTCLFEQVAKLRGAFRRDKIARLEGAILISSAATTTPFHFDPEIGFFSQITGEKIYHVFSPSSVSEPDLESFYRLGILNIGQVDLAACDPAREHIYRLTPGNGFHQPQNAPHWVKTGNSLSVSYTFAIETESMRAANRARAFNHYLRKLRLAPAPVGANPGVDWIKAKTMRVAIPVQHLTSRMFSAN
jgi:hypothetical protein